MSQSLLNHKIMMQYTKQLFSTDLIEPYAQSKHGEIIKSLTSINNANVNTPINCYKKGNKNLSISAPDMIEKLKATCKIIGIGKLGFSSIGVGTHSIRTSFAMQLELSRSKT